MNVITRGIRNAFRNVIRTFSLVGILGLSIGLALAMLVAYQAVGKKIDSVKSSIGNTVSVSPAGVRGFEGGGDALTETQLAKVKTLAHVTAVSASLNDRLTTSNTNIVSAIDAGSLGRRNAGNNGQGFNVQNGGGAGRPSLEGDGAMPTITRTFTPPVTLVGTTDPTNLSAASAQGGGRFKLKSGAVYSATSTENVALVGSTLATKNSLTVGSTFTAYDQTVKVVGIFDAGNAFSNNQIMMPLKAVQTLSSQPDAVTSATLTVDSITNVAAVTTATQKALGTAADVTNAAAAAETTIAPLQNIRTISLYSLIGAVAAGAVIILMTMIMIVRERRREIGVLKAIGASNIKIMSQFMVEAVTLTLLASFVGILLGVLAGNPITKLLVSNATSTATTASAAGAMARGPGGFGRGAERAFGSVQNSLSTIHAAVGWSIILYGLAAALVIALIGSALASFFIAKIRPAEVMRAD